MFLKSAETSGALRVGCKAKLQKNSARFGEGNMKDHGNKPIELDSFLKGSLGRYTELIRLCFQHKWIASLGAVSTVLCTPLLKK